jgi:hypothetical protein
MKSPLTASISAQPGRHASDFFFLLKCQNYLIGRYENEIKILSHTNSCLKEKQDMTETKCIHTTRMKCH